MEVTPEVYYAYFRMERQERGQEEKKSYNKVVSYDALDDEEKKVIDNIPDVAITSMDEIVIANDMKNRLHRALDLLPKGERELLQAIYFQGKTEEKYGNEVEISQKGIPPLWAADLSVANVARVSAESRTMKIPSFPACLM